MKNYLKVSVCILLFVLAFIRLAAQDIYTAVRNGDVAQVREILSSHPEFLNQKNQDLLTPLNLAAEQNKPEVASLLLEMGADPTIGDRENSQPIHLAAVSGSIQIIQLLLDYKVDINTRDINGMTALLFAASRGQAETVRYLASKGANVKDKTSNGLTALHMAAISGNVELMGILVDKGAQVNTSTPQGHTPLHSACSYGRTDAVKFLAEHGADINAKTEQGEPPLLWAVGRNSLGAAEYLLSHGADVNYKTPDGFTALHQAAGRGNVAVARLFLRHGADVNAAANTGLVPLAYASWAENAAEMGRLLILNGADVNPDPCSNNKSCTCGPNFMTPLHSACMMGRLEMAEILISNGARINLLDEDGLTPLHYAVKKGNTDLVSLLTDHGAFLNVQEPNMGCTELHFAACMGYGDIAGLLMEKGSCYTIRDDNGKTPLDYSFAYGQERIAFDMIGEGADEEKLTEWLGEECQLSKQLTRGDASIWFLGHSGWAIKTQNHFLVFDYWEDARSRKPDHACLNSGCIDTSELKREHVTVFSTHDHQDHYNASIFGWKNGIPETEYVLCFNPAGETGEYTYIPEHSRTTVDGMDIYVIHSTDLGGGYLVEVDGLVIFFMGDHANGEDRLMEEYTSEIDDIADMGKEIDLLFSPIRGCSLGTPEQVKTGIYYTLDKLHPDLFIPMHSGNFSFEYKAFADQAKADGVPQKMVYPVSKGDRFLYKKGSGIEGLSRLTK